MISPEQSAEYWRKVSKTVNYDGFNEWYRAKGAARKLFWTIIMIGTVVAIIYYAYTVTMQYLARPSATQIIEKRSSSMQFPNVTICHTARFSRSYIHQRIIIRPEFAAYGFKRYDTDEVILDDFVQWLSLVAYQVAPATHAASLEFLYQFYFNRTVSPYAEYELVPFLKDAAVPCGSLLKRCAFGTRLFDCCKNVKTIWTDYGTCYQITIVGRDAIASQAQPGTIGGLKVWARVSKSEVAPSTFDPNNGLKVYFTVNQVTPHDDPVYVSPNSHALIRLEATQYSFDQSVENCTDHPPPIYGVEYSLGTCANDCMRNISIEYCGCKPLGYGVPVQTHEACTPRAMAQCVLPLTMGFVDKSKDTNSLTEYKNCAFEKCPRLCNEWVYKTYASYQNVMISPYPQFPYEQPHHSSDTEVFVFTAFYGEIKYTKVQSAPLWDFITFISNVGGLIGLWTGMSVVTAIQILVYCYLIPCCYEEGKSTTFLVPESMKEKHNENGDDDHEPEQTEKIQDKCL